MALASPSRRYGELGFAAALVAAAGFFFLKADEFPGLAGSYPKVLAVLLGVGGCLVIVRTLSRKPARDGEPLFTHTARFVFGFVVLAVYVLSISLVGYLVPSLVFGIALPLVLGYRDIRMSVGVTLGTLVFIVLVFVVVLGRPIPRDVLDPFLVLIR